MNRIIPKYFTDTKNIIAFAVFTAIFCICFVNIYNPFGWLDDYDKHSAYFIFYSCSLVIIGVVAIVFSRVFMHYYSKKHQFTYLKYCIWLVVEVFVLSLLYTFFSIYIEYKELPGILLISEKFRRAISNVVIIIALPYFISSLYFSLQDKNMKLKQIKNESLSNVLDHIAFYDGKGVLKISITRDNIVYIESADNYVLIKYLNKGKLSEFLLRNTIRAVSKKLSNSPIQRCHRSYMVNFSHVKVIRKDKDGMFIEVDVEGIKDIPVSKTYYAEVTRIFLSDNSN